MCVIEGKQSVKRQYKSTAAVGCRQRDMNRCARPIIMSQSERERERDDDFYGAPARTLSFISSARRDDEQIF